MRTVTGSVQLSIVAHNLKHLALNVPC